MLYMALTPNKKAGLRNGKIHKAMPTIFSSPSAAEIAVANYHERTDPTQTFVIVRIRNGQHETYEKIPGKEKK